jgi:hypothetical protein
MVKKKLSGYAVRQELTRARNANHAARVALDRILETPTLGQSTIYMLLSKAALALGTILEAVDEIERIARDADPER